MRPSFGKGRLTFLFRAPRSNMLLKTAFVLVTILVSLATAQQNCGSINVGGNAYNLDTLAAPYAAFFF